MTTSFAPCKQPLTNTHMWHVVNGRGLKVGHAASRIARLLIGKHKPTYNPAFDAGDYVVVTNAEKLIFTGDKWKQKLYRWHTGYPGGLKALKAKDMLYKHPDAIIRTAVSKMLPKNKLRWERLKRLRVFVGEEHPHEGQVSQGYHYQIEPQSRSAIDPALAAFRDQVVADPDAFVRKYGGGKFSIVPQEQGMAVVATKIKGTHAHAVRSFGNTRSLRAARLDRLRKVVEDIQSAQAREAAKRDPL